MRHGNGLGPLPGYRLDIWREGRRELLQIRPCRLSTVPVDEAVETLVISGANGIVTEAERAAAAEQGREQRRRFLTPGSGYTPGNAQMFNNGN